ncbi:hypothetical protein PR202_gb17006 [Eleusine coracana subsp. coracana]|uniref:F-box domain-containing protein n=1 Tax=Eleusine coracana subsp. coracana TaxID=191504 RepID=A0AAV5F2H4_ELECO|nr:hypothetical protein PR202_gb17006 [Eleusine coracana subsp. coracana]
MDLSGLRIASVQTIHAFNGQDQGTATALKAAYESLPTPPATAAAWSTAVPNDGVDRISRLPDQILQNIVSRLPAQDAVRTGALASRWRSLWRSGPSSSSMPASSRDHLLLPRHEQGEDQGVDAAGRRQGRPRAFLHQSPVAAQPPPPRHALQLHIPHPPAHRRLEVPQHRRSFRKRGISPPKELFLTLITMKDRDLAFLLDRSPVLEVLTIIASQTDVRLCLISNSLRCLQLGMSTVGDIVVAYAPRLERLLLWKTQRRRTGDNKFSRIKIGKAPNLNMLGYWHPGQHQLQIGDTIIESGTEVSPCTIIPSVKTLALEVHFEVRKELMTVPSFLQCFPNVETLHIKPMKVNKPTGKVKLNCWLEACPVQCVLHVKTLVIHEFKGSKNEHAFIKFIVERAPLLEKMVIMLCPESFYNCSRTTLHTRMKSFLTVKWAGKLIKKIHIKVPSTPTPWSFRIGVDLSRKDPFDIDSVI